MKITLTQENDAVLFKAVNEDGQSLMMDGSPEVGGVNGGFRPMQTLLAGLGGCSAIDIVDILKKQRQPVEGIQIEVTAEREKQQAPSLFTQIHIHYLFKGKQLELSKVQKAVSLSVDKYCSVARIMEKTATISYEISLEE